MTNEWPQYSIKWSWRAAKVANGGFYYFSGSMLIRAPELNVRQLTDNMWYTSPQANSP